jgi:hypothetical protein
MGGRPNGRLCFSQLSDEGNHTREREKHEMLQVHIIHNIYMHRGYECVVNEVIMNFFFLSLQISNIAGFSFLLQAFDMNECSVVHNFAFTIFQSTAVEFPMEN